MHKKGLAFLKAMKALAFLNLGFHEKNCGNNLVIMKKSTYTKSLVNATFGSGKKLC